MAEQPIPVPMLDAAEDAISALGYRRDTLSLREVLKIGFEAANVPALLAERDALRLTISTKLAPMVAEAQAEARELRAELAELQASSDLRWNADQRARERWRAAHPDQPLTWPDHVDLCVWLMAELETAPTAAERGKGDL